MYPFYPFYYVHNVTIGLYADYPNIGSLLKGEGPSEDMF